MCIAMKQHLRISTCILDIYQVSTCLGLENIIKSMQPHPLGYTSVKKKNKLCIVEIITIKMLKQGRGYI